MGFPGDSGAPQPSEPFGLRPRCGIHDVALDDEFRCVLCMRAAGSDRSWGGAARVAIVAAAALVAYVIARDMTTDPLTPTAVLVATPPSSAQTAPPAEADEPTATAPRVLPRHHGSAPAAKRRPVRMPRRIGGGEPATAPGPRHVSQIAIEAEMHHVPIVMYATNWCPYCAKARAWLSANGYPYAERDVDADESAKETRDRLVPSGGVPVFTVGGAVVNGFSPAGLEGAIRRQAERSLKR